MGVKYGKFELPVKIKVEESSEDGKFARFVAEPFERGFGHTIGNALRRIMLSSLESPSIISVKIEGVSHEYTAIDGVIEDMTHIVLNLKGALLRKLPSDEESRSRDEKVLTKTLEVTSEMIENGRGQYVVKFKDLIGDTDFEVVNPDHAIFTAVKPQSRRVDLKVAIGRGYVPSERHVLGSKVNDEIVMDSSFSAVRVVNYFVENTRVGQDTDYDRLVIDVTTDGRILPQEALSFATQICTHHLQVFEELEYVPINFDVEETEENTDRDAVMSKLALKINEIELSVRSTNCLAQANIETIAELVVMPESDMLKFRNFGKKSLNEIKAKLEEMGLHLGMDLHKYGINKDNVKEVVSEYLNNKLGQEA